MRKYPRNVEEKDNYLSLLIFPNLMLYIIAFAGFDYFYNNVFCEFKAELHLTKILYFLMIVICSYNASKLIILSDPHDTSCVFIPIKRRRIC